MILMKLAVKRNHVKNSKIYFSWHNTDSSLKSDQKHADSSFECNDFRVLELIFKFVAKFPRVNELSPFYKMDKIVSLGDLLSKYKTVRHFCEAYSTSGKVLIEDQYVSWYYIRQIVTGEKKLLNIKDVENIDIPPRSYNKT